MSDRQFSTKLDVDSERHNLWYQVIRGLAGIIWIMERYAKAWTTHCPTNEIRRQADRLNALAKTADEQGIADPTQPTFDFK